MGVTDGFLKNEAVKILMPEKLRKVDTTLRSLGLGSLADQGVKLLNRAAEDAVTEAAPIFTNAITSMTITDAKIFCWVPTMPQQTIYRPKPRLSFLQLFSLK